MRDDLLPRVGILQPDDCWALLRSAYVGRLAAPMDDWIEIFPVNYVVDGSTVVFRTGEGTKLSAAVRAGTVAFEVDGGRFGTGVAWSVVLKGYAERVLHAEDMTTGTRLPLHPWHDRSKDSFVRVVPQVISGRRFTIPLRGGWAPITAHSSFGDQTPGGPA